MSKDRSGDSGLVLVVVAVLLTVAAIWRSTPLLVPWALGLTPNAEKPAELFEIVNALFSGLALAGVVAAILLQSHELRLQRQELEETRDELKGQKDALVTQNQLLNLGNTQQVLVPLLLEYRSRPMYEAISALWELHRAHPSDFVAVYRGMEVGNPLHYQRRIVSHLCPSPCFATYAPQMQRSAPTR